MTNIKRRLPQLTALKRLKDFEKKCQLVKVNNQLKEKQASQKAVEEQMSKIEVAIQNGKALIAENSPINPILLESQSIHVEHLYENLAVLNSKLSSDLSEYKTSLVKLADVHSELKMYSNSEAELRAAMEKDKEKQEILDLVKERHTRSIDHD